ncbi:MAG: hypothetical protein IKB59_03650 [Alphaproteobacteria bacterium]|nr:hypothetical protein [Alphaproteobacteria bacterium]
MARRAIKVIIQQRKHTFALNVFNSLSLSLDFCGILSFFSSFFPDYLNFITNHTLLKAEN